MGTGSMPAAGWLRMSVCQSSLARARSGRVLELGVASASVATLATLDDLQAIRSEWDELFALSGGTVFQSWDWVVTWYEHFAADGSLRVLAVRDGDGRLVGVVPCSLTVRRGVRWLYLLGRGCDLTEYVDAIVHPDHADLVARAVAESWDGDAANWDLLELRAVPRESVLNKVVQRLVERGYWALAREQGCVRRMLPADWRSFYRSINKNMKDNINNYTNRLKRAGHAERLTVVDTAQGLDEALDILFRLHRLRAESDLKPLHENRFASPARRSFLRTVAARLTQRGGRIWSTFLHVDGQPVAAQLWLIQGQTLYRYYSGFDPAWSRYGAMLVLTRRCIEYALERGFERLDLLLGVNQEKLRWGGEEGRVGHFVLASPRARSRVSLLLYRLYKARHRQRAVAVC